MYQEAGIPAKATTFETLPSPGTQILSIDGTRRNMPPGVFYGEEPGDIIASIMPETMSSVLRGVTKILNTGKVAGRETVNSFRLHF